MTAALRAHRADIQGLRAFAVLLVVLFHADLPVPGGFTGVDVFFVISGFVITRLLWRELQDRHEINLVRFYTRRARRLLPALALVLVFVALAGAALSSPLGGQQLIAKTGAAAALYIANAALFVFSGGYFDTPSNANPLLHTWTLAVEEQFYLFFPLLLAAAWRVRRASHTAAVQRGVAVVAVGAVLVGSFAACIYMATSEGLPFGDQPANNRFAFFGSPTRAWEFAAGSLLAIGELRLSRLPRAAGVIAGVLGLLVTLIGAFGLNSKTTFPGVAALLPVVGAALMILAGTITNAGVSRLLTLPAMTWIGDRSYGWYLWHWPFIVFARDLRPDAPRWWLTGAALLSLLPTALSYRYVENPVRHNRRYRGRRVLNLAAACTLIPVLLFGALFASTRYPAGAFRNLQAQLVPHLDETAPCLGNLPGDAAARRRCTWGPSSAAGSVLLLGDSNAGHFAEPVAEAAFKTGLRMTMATFGGCPFADVRTRYDVPFDEAGCERFVAQWSAEVGRLRPRLVLLSSSSSEYVRGGNGVTFEDPTGALPPAVTTAMKAAAWRAGVARTMRSWALLGVPTVVVHTVPHFKEFDLRTCPSFKVLVDEQSCGRRMSLASAQTQVRPATEAEEQAVVGILGAGTLNLFGNVCPSEVCVTNRGSSWLYRDGVHLSVRFARTLTGRFEDAMLQSMNRFAEGIQPSP